MNWIDCPNLFQISLTGNQIKELNWKNAPTNFNIDLRDNQITGKKLNWRDVPLDANICINGNNCIVFEEYKVLLKSGNYIPPLPEITREYKELLIYPLITEYFCIPPNVNKKKVFIKGGPHFKNDNIFLI